MTLSSSTVLGTAVADAVPTYAAQWSTPKTRTLPLGEGMTPANRDALRVRMYARLNDAMPLTSRRARGLLRTLSALVACVDVEGRAIIRQEVLGERMFCTKRTVQRHIRDLEQLGLITQTRSTKRYRHYESGREGASGYQLLDTAIRDTQTPPITPPEAAQKSTPPLPKSVVMSPLEMTSCHPSSDVMSPLIGSDSEKQEQSTQAAALAVGQCAALAAVRGATHADAVAPPAPPNGVASSPPADAESNLRTAILSVWPDMFTRQLEEAISVFRDHPHGSYTRGMALVERGRTTGKGAGWFVTATRSEQTQPTPEKTKEPRAALTGTTTTVAPMYHQRAAENSEYLRDLEQAETNPDDADDTDAQAYADATRRAVQTMTRAGRLGEVAAVLAQAKAMSRPDAMVWLDTHGCVDSEESARSAPPAHV